MMIPVGLQLYSIKEAISHDFIGTLEKVKEAGYDCVEFAGYNNMKAEVLSAELDRIGLQPYSSHVSWQQLQNNLDEVAAYSETLGLKWVVCPGYPIQSRQDCLNLAELLNKAAEVLNEKGIQVGYHNHSHEFEKYDGHYALDLMLEHAAEGKVYAELDVCWAQYADVDPLTYLDSLGKKAGPMHCKDINSNYKDLKGEDINVEVGAGMLDFEALFQIAQKHGNLEKGLIVEQEAFTRDPFESIAMSCRYIRETLAKMNL